MIFVGGPWKNHPNTTTTLRWIFTSTTILSQVCTGRVSFLSIRVCQYQHYSKMPSTRSGKSTWIAPPITISSLSATPNHRNAKMNSNPNYDDADKPIKSVDFSSFAYQPAPSLRSSKRITRKAATSTKIEPKQEELPDPVSSSSTTSVEKKRRQTKSNSPPSTPKKKVPKKKKGTSSRKTSPKKIEPGSLEPPKNWDKIYSLVEELRSDRTAPVDSDGAEALTEKHLGPKVFRFQVLIALMLSSQTKDAVVGETMRSLQSHGLTVENIHNETSQEKLNELIFKVGFHNNKAKYIKQTAAILVDRFQGDIPKTAEEMIDQLPGVGPKMAYLVESIAWNHTSGIGVDTHMHRMFNDLKWVSSKYPEGTREQLEGWLPREKWAEINLLWVGFGQEVQQQKEKTLQKALSCSRPVEALALLSKLGFNVKKEAKKYKLEDELANVMERKPK